MNTPLKKKLVLFIIDRTDVSMMAKRNGLPSDIDDSKWTIK